MYNHVVFGPEKGKDGNIGKTDEELIHDLISIHNAENWLGGEGDDFAPNFFSGVIPPEATGVATPSSSSGGMASGVSSRSQTPDAAASKEAPTAVVSLPEFKPNSADTEIEATQDQVSTETLTDPSPLATLSLSPSGAVLESECSVNEKSASPTDNVKSENDAVADDSAVKPEENTDHIDRDSPEAPNKTNDGKFSIKLLTSLYRFSLL